MSRRETIPEPRLMRREHRLALQRELMNLSTKPPRRRVSRVAMGAIVFLALTGGAAAAAAYAHFRPITNTDTAHCYTLPRVGKNGTTVAVAGRLGSREQVVNALGTCGMLWRDGFLAKGVPHIIRVTETTTVHPVPNLVVCTMPNGTAGVFPGTSSTCASLKLPMPKKS